MTTKQYLLSFSIGPVQTFIATARRTQDLWFGSRLLSELMYAGLIVAKRDPTVELIAPAAELLQDDLDEISGIPNLFLAICDEPNQLANRVQESIEAAWQDRASRIMSYLSQQNRNFGKNKTLWQQQTASHQLLEFYWAACPYDENQHQASFRQVGRLMGARKTIRNFEQIEDGRGRKCTLCGERKALIWSKNMVNLKVNERLCSICAIKRFDALAHGQTERFPSTSTIPVIPFLNKLLEAEALPEVKQAQTAFRSALQALETYGQRGVLLKSAKPQAVPYLQNKGTASSRSLDGSLFFIDTLNPNGRLKNDYALQDVPQDKVATAVDKLKALHKAVEAKPTPYYALLIMDGDRMGKRLAAAEKKEDHQTISRKLADFTKQVKQIVEQDNMGRLVYAGGDDVFALLPLEIAIPVTNQLRLAFGKILPGGTMSAGIAIAHHLTPLSFVRQKAQEAEKLAKNRYQRNALVTTVLKRSGAPLIMGAQWSHGIVELMTEIVNHFQADDELSSKVAYDLVYAQRALSQHNLPRAAKKAEIQRLLTRHWAESKPLEAIAKLAERLTCLMEKLDPLVDDHGFTEMINWLLLARFLAGGAIE